MAVGLVHDLQEPILYVMSDIGSTFIIKNLISVIEWWMNRQRFIGD